MKRFLFFAYVFVLHVALVFLVVYITRDAGGPVRFEQVRGSSIPESWGEGWEAAFGGDYTDWVGRLMDDEGNVVVTVFYEGDQPALLNLSPPGSPVAWSFTSRGERRWKVGIWDTRNPEHAKTPHEGLVNGFGLLKDMNADGMPEEMSVKESADAEVQEFRLADDPWVPVED